MAILNHGRSIVMDPSLLEETLADGTITIAMNHLGEVCYLTKTGGVLLDSRVLMKCIGLARNQIESLRTLLQKACLSHKIRKKDIFSSFIISDRVFRT